MYLLHAHVTYFLLRARKRVGWLEDKMEQVLGKKRQRVSVIGCVEFRKFNAFSKWDYILLYRTFTHSVLCKHLLVGMFM